MITIPPDTKVNANDNFEITCKVDAFPPETNLGIIRARDGLVLANFNTSEGSHTLGKLSLNDTGIYSCEAANDVGGNSASFMLTVRGE